MADIKTSTMDNLHTQNGNFMCGVVEGFYGRPWTTEQRKDLFQKLKKWGMDSYVYAPKDDYKHRAYWRELYSVEEAEHLTGLVSAARDCGITFYYALSPGLDITYSSSKEIAALKRKLEQVSQFGCVAFALLFDDIEPEMSEADKEVFQSFAHAQVSISNDIFQHLNQPKFLLCPTQYCAARAMPNVQNSEYLNTIGAKLAPEIDIMWTGPKVISRLLTVESIEEVTEVMRRPPVIWDNLHANDYDQKRVFLGPYSGRSPDLIRRLRGVLTNPNCEYGANFVAIHTLAQWSRCNADGRRDLSLNDTVSADIKLETETEDGCVEEAPLTLSPNMYHPKRALRNAINEWLPEFRRKKSVTGLMAKPQQVLVTALVPPVLPSINTCMSLTTTTMSNASGGSGAVATSSPSTPTPQGSLQALAEVGPEGIPVQPPPSVPIMNSLVAGNKVVCLERVGVPPVEPMDCNPTPESSPERTGGMSAPVEEDVPMVESGPSLTPQNSMNILAPGEGVVDQEDEGLSHDDLALLCDLFYLPFEHGHQGLQLLQEFHWLKANAHVVTNGNRRGGTDESIDPEATEWRIRARRLDEMAGALDRLFTRLAHCQNRELVYDLYPYVWDMRGIVSLLNSYVKWLAAGQVPQMVSTYVQGTCTWFSKGWKEAYMSGEQEPWVFRGGLTADLQRLIPVDSSNDLFVYKAPDMPSGKMYKIRPCMPSDAASVYDVCRRTCSDGMDGSSVFVDMPNLIGDKLVGAFLALSPEFCFAVEEIGDDCFEEAISRAGQSGRSVIGGRVVGYAVAALDARQFYRRLEIAWLPEMCDKYPRPEKRADSDTLTPAEEIIEGLHNWKGDVPEVILAQHPSLIATSILNTVLDQSVAKHLVTILLAALRANGSFGCFTELSVRDKYTIEFYSKLGFVELGRGNSEDMVYFGRTY
ncbi:protein O-GlcNAcase isoform X2 [Ischnura elegans]|uniref:protein O-GlcNAcase isoform X2 n=1 Tax=Ischnura elegans TaxID=197161 RepID=UPI001ED867EE|nr:protein O-GlcNAcase isoform X2 [Ischnura elegans]